MDTRWIYIMNSLNEIVECIENRIDNLIGIYKIDEKYIFELKKNQYIRDNKKISVDMYIRLLVELECLYSIHIDNKTFHRLMNKENLLRYLQEVASNGEGCID